MPAHALWLNWEFAAEADQLEYDITFHNDPGSSVGSYFAPFNGYVGSHLAYGGFQTNIQHPDGHAVGKGAIFSTWSTFDANDAILAESDAFVQLGTHEGKFLGVRRAFPWTAGHLRFSLQRTLRGERQDWFDCTVTGLDRGGAPGTRPGVVGEPLFIGALRIAPQRFTKGQLSFLEVYADAETFADVTDWHIDVMAYADGVRAVSLRTEYPDFPNKQEMPNADAWFDPATDRANLRFGGATARTTPAQQVF